MTLNNDKIYDMRFAEEQINGDKHILKCSACGRELVEIWITRPQAAIQSKIRALCECGDHSFEKTFSGLFSVGEVESGQSRLVNMKTEMIEENGVLVQKLLIITMKGDENHARICDEQE